MKKQILILASLLLLFLSSKAQLGDIIYRDFNPDSILIVWQELGPMYINLDEEGETDLKMWMVADGSMCVPYMGTLQQNLEICAVEPYCVLSEVPEDNWSLFLDWSIVYANDNYGFRIEKDDGYYYGWFRTYTIEISGKEEKRVVHWAFDETAYCTIPDYPLRWGQTEIGTTPPVVSDIYTVGYKDENATTRSAMLFKNSELLYSINVENKKYTPCKITADTLGNLYWMVVRSENGSSSITEIWKNDELFVSTDGCNRVAINDIYCLGDMLFYVGDTLNRNGKKVATVWCGSDFKPYWVLGDGLQNSVINDADVDESTNIPYFCGYIANPNTKAVVWKASQRLFTCEPNSSYMEKDSYAQEISVKDGVVYTKGYKTFDYNSFTERHPFLWRIYNNEIIGWMAQVSEKINGICTFEKECFFCDDYRQSQRYSVCRNNSSHEVLAFPYPLENETSINNIRRGFNDIYMVGGLDGQGCVWKNFELFSQYDNCDVIVDLLAVEPPELNGNPFEEPCQAPASFWGFLKVDQETHKVEMGWNPPPSVNWYHYDENPLAGIASDYDHWGICIPGETFTHNEVLTDVAFYKTGCQGYGNYSYCVEIYKGGIEEPLGDFVSFARADFTSGPDEWVTVRLSSMVVCEEGKNIWIVLRTPFHGNSMPYCQTSGNPNGRWASYGNGWIDFGLGDWMIRGGFHTSDTVTDIDHYNVYRGSSLDSMEVIAEVAGDQLSYVDNLSSPLGDYYYQLTVSRNDGCESGPAISSSSQHLPYLYFHFENDWPLEGEWYYEITNANGSITYQYLQCVGDTTVAGERPKIIVRTNTIYDDKGKQQTVTHEYVYEKDSVVYWWNKELQEFTTLYDLTADVGDEWVINVGTESLVMHVDAVSDYEYDGRILKMLSVSDENDLFSGDIVCGIGHLISFFPERLMNRGKGYRVEGIRCYWQDGELVFKLGEKDCDEVYQEYHNQGVDETETSGFRIYPNPATDIIVVETLRATSLQGQTEYRITNTLGQTLLSSSSLRAERSGARQPEGSSTEGRKSNLTINVSSLPSGMYFLTLGNQTLKFIKQ